MSDICVLGNFVADNSFYAKNYLERPNYIWDRLSGGPGGKGSNQAIAAARLGESKFLGKIGDDANGKMAIDLYKKIK